MDEFYFYYILSLFNENKEVTVSQISNSFQGKRTPSMFYLAEINNWHHIFGTEKHFDQEKLNKILKVAENETLLEKIEDGYILTKLGHESCARYFKQHYYPQKIMSFSNINIRIPFWDRVQLFTQVFSELSYNNSQYIPVVKHPHHQESVRMLFQAFPDDREKVLAEWIREQHFILQSLNSEGASILLNQISSHNNIGKTNSQLSQALEMNKLEFNHYMNDLIEEYILLVEKHRNSLPIMYSILKQMHEETNYGLSHSTFQTYQLLEKNYTLQQIAQIRQLKVNTIREHILEMAFVLNSFSYEKFMPEDIYDFINNKLATNDNLSFRDLNEENEAVEFMHYRLVELERMRADGD